jgi:chemosensory pili system protein ChpA (sensor histidine kinase/response regulator)
MDETFNQDNLSAEDLAILRAFDEMNLEHWEGASAQDDTSARPSTAEELNTEFFGPEEMLALFVAEAEEDITTIRRTVQQLEPDDSLDTARLQTIQRTAHKLKGTTGAVGCMTMSTIALSIEELVKLLNKGTIVPFIGLNALGQTTHAFERTLNSFVTYGEESSSPLAELEAEYKALNIDIADRLTAKQSSSPHVEEELSPINAIVEASPVLTASEEQHATSFVRVDVHHFDQLVQHTEQLAELSSPLESAQAEVEKALQELHIAQARLQHLETIVTAQLTAKNFTLAGQIANNERPSSSLVARILDESAQRTGHFHQRKSKYQAQLPKSDALQWDALEIDRFTESDVLAHSLGEAIADVATASAQLRTTIARLSRLTRQHIDQATNVRNDTLLLRLTPIGALLTRIEHAIMMSPLAQQQRVLFDVEGAETEIDQDILEELQPPLLQLVRTCTAQSSPAPAAKDDNDGAENKNAVSRTWLYALAVGNEVTIEIGFSMMVGGRALNEVQEAIRRLNGSITARRNSLGGFSFHLRLPRSQGALQGFLVRTGSYRVVVPISQVQRIDNGKQVRSEPLYTLHSLLGFPVEQTTVASVRPVLILASETRPMAVQVDEIVEEVKLVVKPLAPHLRRPGIIGIAIDGRSTILLIVDLPELINHYELQESTIKVAAVRKGNIHDQYPAQTRHSILIADDSVYIRKSLRQSLAYAGYLVREAADGMKTLEQLLDNPPDVLLLDVEMPNLNGYDVLSMMRVHPELARVKTIMLTSRSSEKHQALGRELGALAFLTKPCPQNALLEILRSLLTS